MIELINLGKKFGNRNLFQYVNLTIFPGDFVTIMGKSGSGKSTLLNILGFLDSDYSGEFLFDTHLVNKMTLEERELLRNKEVGYIFQSFNLINEYNVLENVELPLGYRGIDIKQRQELSLSMLEKVGLSDKIKEYPKNLSGGEQQRVSIARTLVTNPRIILADEPTGNLDEQTGIEIMNLFDAIHSQGVTVVMVTHDKDLAKRGNKKLRILDEKLIEI